MEKQTFWFLLGAMLKKKTDDQQAFIGLLRQITIYVMGLKPVMEYTCTVWSIVNFSHSVVTTKTSKRWHRRGTTQ